MSKKVILAQVFLILSFALSACSGSDTSGGDITSSADTMTVTVPSPTGTATTTYTEGSQGYLVPWLSSNVTPTHIYITLHSDPHNITSSTNIYIAAIGGNTPQSYPLDINNSPSFINCDINNQTYSSALSSPSGTITISNIGNMGKKITGAFDAVVAGTSSTDTLNISGTFSVTRDN
jgi:hypothetical protein